MVDRAVVRVSRAAMVLLVSTAPAVAQAPVALINVNVVPMDSERVLSRQTVVADSGRIVRIGPTGETPIPPGVRVLDGAGAFLMPGLADMHVHLVADSNELALYVANGVTTVRDLSGEPEYFDWRREIEAGRRTGPNILIGSPLIDRPVGRRVSAWYWGVSAAFAALLMLVPGLVIRLMRARRARHALYALSAAAAITAGYLLARTLAPFPDWLIPPDQVAHRWVGSPREAASVVRNAGGRYDAVKLYEHLSPAEFASAVRAARQAGIHSVAHVPLSMDLEEALHSGLDELAHLYFLVVDLQATTDTATAATAGQRDAAYRRRLAEVVVAVSRSGVDVTSTLMPMPELLEQWTDSMAFKARDDLKYRTPSMRRYIADRLAHPAAAAQVADVRMHVTWGSVAARELVQAGVPLVLGTDNAPFTAVAGFGVHEELQMLLASGLTPYQALRTATVNAGRVAGASSRWGRVAVGQRADLILSSGNPLAEPGTLRRPLGVMVAGRWYDRAGLDSLLEAVVRRRAGS